MKRNFELLKKILELVESRPSTSPLHDIEVPGYDTAEVNYHVYLLDQAGFIDAKITRVGANEIYSPIIFDLTWRGHEFLDNARNNTVWKKAIDTVKSKGGSVSFEIFQKLLSEIAISIVKFQ